MTKTLVAIANAFTQSGTVNHVQSFGSGNINDTFLVTLSSATEKPFILQRINTQVFRQPKLVMQNMQICTEHMRSRLESYPLPGSWQVPSVLFTQTGLDHYIDADGSFWRAISAIENSESFDKIANAEQAQEVGYALGTFHNLVSDLPPKQLADTLEGFHITPRYLQIYEAILQNSTRQLTPEFQYCIQFIDDRSQWSTVLENAKFDRKLPLRLMHGDPKINNVLFDKTTQKAISLIDLDTVKPGLIHYDMGDGLRSACNPAGEEPENLNLVRFDTEICQDILQGYFSVAQSFWTDPEYGYLYDAIRLLAFELGLRFFTDHLAGNVYFKTQYPDQNLDRAIVQFKLTESIENQEKSILQIIRDCQKTEFP